MSIISKRNAVGTLSAAFVAAAATVALGVGSASAAAKDIKVQEPLGGYGTGCTYKVSANVTEAGDAYFYEREKGGEWVELKKAEVKKAGTVSFDWTPKKTGDRELRVAQFFGTGAVTSVKVVKGTDLGSVCLGL
ncbi:hypothetical protein GII30_05265 [Gordonia amarae]|uniref:Secreted protein n=2 Tax=Gordonia amarae TaxID=36821 RepID=G7GTR9_9ACTN|nr:hypothetical protein [Gordonia amarae]MCS3877778.1 hypothetical protein [Gordonia amarae]QHN16473.1 hypothetical protein GII35_05270 [Gordonia amarae]QHN21042.1 hypothetical protein GII34_05270 [Gordonia amarae]QHN29894.1 hypothetical protein GII32_05280 [Gordonia amarae]QHN38669.1 hypothetical protein GII30_05265 [Gordonia amarae]